MTREELFDKLNEIQKLRCETQTLELKSASLGCPKRLYDTLSSFANQDEGGIILFGIDEQNNYEEVGVYDPHDLQKKVNEQCLQMIPVIRPVFTVIEKNNKYFVSAEIPSVDITDRPCYYAGQGRLKGSFVRSGDSDEHMTEYEVYSYEAFKKKYQDDIRVISQAPFSSLQQDLLQQYLLKIKMNRPNLSALSDSEIYELMSITKNNEVTLFSELMFGIYPQAYFPQLSINAVSIQGKEIGDLGKNQERFIDNQRIEGTLIQMLESALQFVRKNMKVSTIIDPETGLREDKTEYPITAVREALLNALIHRDYSIHTEGKPIQLFMFEDRLEIHNPGGIYGRIKIDQLGKIQPDTRNPVIAVAMEKLGITENRYSGIPAIYRSMKEYDLPDPIFIDERGTFQVIFYKKIHEEKIELNNDEIKILEYCQTPRTRKELIKYLGLSSSTYAIQTYIDPLVKRGLIKLSIPEKPSSRNQTYKTK